MGYREEPQYKVYTYKCPHCEETYREANSTRQHRDYQVCPKCGRSGKQDEENSPVTYRSAQWG